MKGSHLFWLSRSKREWLLTFGLGFIILQGVSRRKSLAGVNIMHTTKSLSLPLNDLAPEISPEKRTKIWQCMHWMNGRVSARNNFVGTKHFCLSGNRSCGTFHCVSSHDPNNSCGVESTESVDAMTTPGSRFAKSVNATILLAFGPRNPWMQRGFWHSVHGIRGCNDTSSIRYTESVYITPTYIFTLHRWTNICISKFIEYIYFRFGIRYTSTGLSISLLSRVHKENQDLVESEEHQDQRETSAQGEC
jgi:hypothetical protein